MKENKVISFFIPNLTGGGAERFIVNLASEFSKRGFKVYLLTCSIKGPYASEVYQDVELIDLNTTRTLFALPKLAMFLRTFQPSVLVSTIYHANMVSILAGMVSRAKTKIIVRESNMHKTLKDSSSSYLAYKMTFFFLKFLYRRCHAIVAVSEAMKHELNQLISGISEKLHLVHNFIDVDEIDKLVKEDVDHPWLDKNSKIPVLLSVGRLSNQKNWPLLLKGFSELVKTKEMRLVILGEGPKRQEIESMLTELDIQDHVSLPGFKQNPFSWMQKSDGFVLSSDAEGFPNVLVQALYCECKIISSDCESGPREILEEGKWGHLFKVGDVDDLILKLEESLESPPLLNLKERAIFFSKVFSKDKCLDLYENIIYPGATLTSEGYSNEIDGFEKKINFSNSSFNSITVPPSQNVVSLFTPSLGGGGAERFMVNLANEFSAKGNKVYLVACSLGSYTSDVREDVEIIDLQSSRVLYSLPKLIAFLSIIKPSTLISTIYHTNMVAVTAGYISRSKTKIIVREDNMSQSHRSKSASFISYKFTFSLKKILYKMSHAVVVLQSAMEEELKMMIPGIENKVKLINNFIDVDRISSLAKEPVNHPWLQDDYTVPVIMSAGRLSNQKNWPLLIKAFSKTLKERKLKLIILGEGTLRGEIEGLIKELKIEKDVSLPGFVTNPYSWMARSEIFILSSDFEGFPNVLLEALCCDCSIISSDCDSGPREILEEGKWGQLFKVGDVTDLSVKIQSALDKNIEYDTKSRARYFSSSRCVEQYEKLFVES